MPDWLYWSLVVLGAIDCAIFLMSVRAQPDARMEEHVSVALLWPIVLFAEVAVRLLAGLVLLWSFTPRRIRTP